MTQSEVEWINQRKEELKKIYEKCEKEIKKKTIKSDWCRGIMSEIDMEEMWMDNRIKELNDTSMIRK